MGYCLTVMVGFYILKNHLLTRLMSSRSGRVKDMRLNYSSVTV